MARYASAGRFIKGQREKAGLSREQVAEKLGAPLKLVISWEQGHHRPGQYRPALADIFGITKEALRDGIKANYEDAVRDAQRNKERVMESQNEMGTLIRTLREDIGMTQERLAGELNVEIKVIADWENGRVQPQQKTLESIAWALGVTPKAFKKIKGRNGNGASGESDSMPEPVEEKKKAATLQRPPVTSLDRPPYASKTMSAPVPTSTPKPVAAPLMVNKPNLSTVNTLRAKRAITMASKSIRSKLAVARLYGDERVAQLAALIEADCDTIDDEAKKLDENQE